ncbi:MAG: hypothetical protein KGQ93_08125 [Cyanobacteria bacterium REEB459]|nr:hypothetical protein [Cyanobacteria bacterium REEB459]
MPKPGDDFQGLVEFIQAARSRGCDDDFISKMLRQYGWPQRQVDRAFIQVYEGLTGCSIPTPAGSSAGMSRDAFLYLLAFTTLIIWIQALGSIAFVFIEYLVGDNLNPSYDQPSWQISFALARLLVAYPVYLAMMRAINRDLTIYPEKYFSGVRKWLTYLTLWVAALILLGTLIALLTSLLRGEVSLRFWCKIAVILLLDGGVLWYYGQWISRSPAAKPKGLTP